MPVIDGDGLSGGKRLRRCSDKARLYWPYLFCTANGFGRFEIDCAKIIAHSFLDFKKPPTASELLKAIEEYREVGLLFMYSHRGEIWAQWDTKDKFLKRHKSSSDRESPAPPEPEFSEWKSTITVNKELPNFSAQVGEKVRGEGIGVGIGIGEGVGKTFPASAGEKITNAPPMEPEPIEPQNPTLFAVAPIPIEEQLADTYAPKIYTRHPQRRRDLGLVGVRKALVALLRQFPKSERAARAQRIDHNHEGWCDFEDWTKDGGEYAKALSNWLKPTKGRWDLEPPARASPHSTKSDRTMEIFMENMADKLAREQQ